MELVLLLLFLSLPFRCFFPSNLYRPAPPRSRNRTVLRRINFYKEELYNRGKAEGGKKEKRGLDNLAVPNSSAFLSLARKGRFSEEGERRRGRRSSKEIFFSDPRRSIRQDFSRPQMFGGGKMVGIGTHGGSSARHNASLHPRENLSSRDLAGCKTSRHLSLNPATSTRGAKERKRGGGSFLFCRNYFPGRASCLIFPRRHPPAFSPRHLASAASDVFGKLVQFPAASMTRLVSETLRGRRAQECFLPSASCRLSSHLSLSLSLSPFFEREERWMLASFFFSLLLLISNASR